MAVPSLSHAPVDAPVTSVSPTNPRERILRIVLPIALGTCTAFLLWQPVRHAIEVWSTTEEFSFGFLVAPVAAALVWWRREALRASISPGSNAALPIVVAGLALYLLAYPSASMRWPDWPSCLSCGESLFTCGVGEPAEFSLSQ
jgi:Transmembrane exosortase (Exosortase_EpsH)